MLLLCGRCPGGDGSGRGVGVGVRRGGPGCGGEGVSVRRVGHGPPGAGRGRGARGPVGAGRCRLRTVLGAGLSVRGAHGPVVGCRGGLGPVGGLPVQRGQGEPAADERDGGRDRGPALVLLPAGQLAAPGGPPLRRARSAVHVAGRSPVVGSFAVRSLVVRSHAVGSLVVRSHAVGSLVVRSHAVGSLVVRSHAVGSLVVRSLAVGSRCGLVGATTVEPGIGGGGLVRRRPGRRRRHPGHGDGGRGSDVRGVGTAPGTHQGAVQMPTARGAVVHLRSS